MAKRSQENDEGKLTEEALEALPPDRARRLREILPDEALDEALEGLSAEEITGSGGLITQLAGRVLESAMGAELTEHLGHEPGERGAGENHRNGSTPKRLQTEIGEVEIETPRDRAGTFEPRIVEKRQRRLAGLDERIIAAYAGGMSTRDISRHLAEIYGVSVSRDTISRVTDAVLEDIETWRSRPLEAVYPVLYLDAIQIRMRVQGAVSSQACYIAYAVTCEGAREVLGLWWRESEGAKFWLSVLNDLKLRGVEDVLICCVDGLAGFTEAIEAVYPEAWVQTCVVHLIRTSMRYVPMKERKEIAASLKPIYTAPSAEAAEGALRAFDTAHGERYPMVTESWERAWENVVPFLALPQELRTVVYTTNAIENLNRQIRKRIKTRGHFPDQEAATKLIYLAIMDAEGRWRKVRNWTKCRRALKIHFGERMPDPN